MKTGDMGKEGLYFEEKKWRVREENKYMQEDLEKAEGVKSHLGSILGRHFTIV